MLVQPKKMDKWKMKIMSGIVTALNLEFGHIQKIWELVWSINFKVVVFHNDNYCSFHTILTFQLGPSIKNVNDFFVFGTPCPMSAQFHIYSY